MKNRTQSVTCNGEEIAQFKTSSSNIVDAKISSDDDTGWEGLLPEEYEMELCLGDNVYRVSMSRAEYLRMGRNGDLK